MTDSIRKQRLIRAVHAAAERHFDVSVAEMADMAGYSTGHFQRVFRQQFGLSPGYLLRHSRIERFGELLRAGMSVTDAAQEAGFNSSSRAHQAASDGLGMAPSSAGAGGRSECIQYATAPSSIGTVLVAATRKGLCAVLLGNDEKELAKELRRRFPNARLDPASDRFRRIQQQVIALIDRSGPVSADLPLDLHGTLFQQKVWAALHKIPAGRTITYGELARRIGLAGGARAVAQACGANPAAVVVPCHRVVAADGSLGGYRWGVNRKRALINRESEMTESAGDSVS